MTAYYEIVYRAPVTLSIESYKCTAENEKHALDRFAYNVPGGSIRMQKN